MLLDTKIDKVFEMVGFGIAAASLPFTYRLPRHPKPLGQLRLREFQMCPQRRHLLSTGVITLIIGESHPSNLPSKRHFG
jgi:hypothetical protein